METGQATFRNELPAIAETQNIQIAKKRKSIKPTSGPNKKSKKTKEIRNKHTKNSSRLTARL